MTQSDSDREDRLDRQIADRAKILSQARRIVVKVGSGVLTGESYKDIDYETIRSIASQVIDALETGRKISIVSSGATTLGVKALNLSRHGLSIPIQQAAAARGQSRLIGLWERAFAERSRAVGQLLLTHGDLSDRRRFLNARNTLSALLDFNVTPVINENDTVSVDEIKFGDNDILSAKVTNIMSAELLVILSDVDGFYLSDPRRDSSAERLPFARAVTEELFALAGDSSSRSGIGGMRSKLRAAREAARFGAATLIISGRRPDSLKKGIAVEYDESTGGSFFFPRARRLSSKKHWIENTLISKGALIVDDGAREALIYRGKSLLPLGITRVEGDFENGAAVDLRDGAGALFGKGLVNYHAVEIERIKGHRADRIEEILGYKFHDEVIHRDDLVIAEGFRSRERGDEEKNDG